MSGTRGSLFSFDQLRSIRFSIFFNVGFEKKNKVRICVLMSTKVHETFIKVHVWITNRQGTCDKMKNKFHALRPFTEKKTLSKEKQKT